MFAPNALLHTKTKPQAVAAAAAAAAAESSDVERRVLLATNSQLQEEVRSRTAAMEGLVAARDEAARGLAEAKQQLEAEQAASVAAKAAAAALERRLTDLSAQVGGLCVRGVCRGCSTCLISTCPSSAYIVQQGQCNATCAVAAVGIPTSQVERLESSEAAAQAAAEAARQQLREANQARLAAAAAAADSGSSSAVLNARVAQLESQVEACRDESRQLSRQVDALQVCVLHRHAGCWG